MQTIAFPSKESGPTSFFSEDEVMENERMALVIDGFDRQQSRVARGPFVFLPIMLHSVSSHTY
jgi:hypothetical protein